MLFFWCVLLPWSALFTCFGGLLERSYDNCKKLRAWHERPLTAQAGTCLRAADPYPSLSIRAVEPSASHAHRRQRRSALLPFTQSLQTSAVTSLQADSQIKHKPTRQLGDVTLVPALDACVSHGSFEHRAPCTSTFSSLDSRQATGCGEPTQFPETPPPSCTNVLLRRGCDTVHIIHYIYTYRCNNIASAPQLCFSTSCIR